MNKILRTLLAMLALVALVLPAGAEMSKLRIAVLKVGTVNWELDTIKHYGLDKKNGFDLEVLKMAGNPATRIAFQGGEADVVVADWIWVARQRAEGKKFSFIPYSTAVGAMMVKNDSGIASLEDLKGKKIGIAGGPVDKSWLLIRAYAQKQDNLDLAGETEQVFGAPPLIFKAALASEVDAAINFWHFVAKMGTKGMHPLVTVRQAAEALGLSPDTPLLGYVVKDEMVEANAMLIKGFEAASREAKNMLATDNAAWARLRPIMNVKSDAEFEALVAGFRAGIPPSGPVDIAAAQKAFALMAELGGEKLVGKAKTLPEGVFVQQ